MLNNNKEPILSVCIPTYNRGECLNKLLDQIFNLSEVTKSKIQICISDNFSSDITSSVILEWRNKLNIVSIRQASNIGGSRNFQAVAALSTAPWSVLMGDDDLFSVSGFEKTLAVLETISPNTWIFADICNQDGTTLLENFPPGPCSKMEFKKKVLLDSLDPLGFMSMHIIPNASIQKFVLLNREQIYGWPHLALLFYDLLNVEIYVHKECIVKRGGDDGEVTQTWRANDWLCLMMQKTKLCCVSETDESMFSTGIALREYLRWPYARQTLSSMLVVGQRRKLFFQANDYINATKINLLTKYFIKLYICLLLIFPVKFINFARKLNNPNAIDICESNYESTQTDGIDRGL